MQNKSLPIRMCCGCGEHILKKDLVRVLRTAEGNVIIDLSGKKSGRGAYICKNPVCLERAIKNRRIERSLSQKISEEIFAQLREELE